MLETNQNQTHRKGFFRAQAANVTLTMRKTFLVSRIICIGRPCAYSPVRPLYRLAALSRGTCKSKTGGSWRCASCPRRRLRPGSPPSSRRLFPGPSTQPPHPADPGLTLGCNRTSVPRLPLLAGGVSGKHVQLFLLTLNSQSSFYFIEESIVSFCATTMVPKWLQLLASMAARLAMPSPSPSGPPV